MLNIAYKYTTLLKNFPEIPLTTCTLLQLFKLKTRNVSFVVGKCSRELNCKFFTRKSAQETTSSSGRGKKRYHSQNARKLSHSWCFHFCSTEHTQKWFHYDREWHPPRPRNQLVCEMFQLKLRFFVAHISLFEKCSFFFVALASNKAHP